MSATSYGATNLSRSGTVSVVLASFNGAKFIREQLDSLANQTHLPHELIISDDGSSDETLSIATQFKNVAPFPVTIIRNERRLGYGENFLSAARTATGVYLAFCDQDDVWMPNKLEAAVTELSTQDIDLHVHTAKVIDDSGAEIGRFTQGIRKRRVLEPLTLPPWGVFYGFAMTFRRAVLDIVDPCLRGGHTFDFEGQLSHDLWIYFICSSLGRVLVDTQDLAKYRRHTSNQTPDIKGSILGTLSSRFGVQAHPKLRRDRIAEHRSQILRQLGRSDTQDNRLRAHAQKASEYWSRIAIFEALRIQAYSQGKVTQRAWTCAKLLLGSGYRSPSAGGLGWRLFVKDALLGVFQVRRWMSNA
jgi:glycosyltransferase involved in cell wall biosynthesis